MPSLLLKLLLDYLWKINKPIDIRQLKLLHLRLPNLHTWHNFLTGQIGLTDVSADHLLGDEGAQIRDKELLKQFEVVQEMNGEARKVVQAFLDMAIRDFKAKQAYAH